MLENPNDLRSCSLADAFMTIGGKWKPYIVWYLNTAPDLTMRYGELKRHIPWTISHKMYAQQLHELEADGIITSELGVTPEAAAALSRTPIPLSVISMPDPLLAGRTSPTVYVANDEEATGAEGVRLFRTLGAFNSYGFAQSFETVPRNGAQTAHAQSRTGERLTVHHGIRQS